MSSTISTTMSTSTTTTMQQLVFNALYKAATPAADAPAFATSEEARDAFIALVMSELFPGTVVGNPPYPAKEKKKRAPKSPKTTESPVAVEAPKTESPKEKKKRTPKEKKAEEIPLPKSPEPVAEQAPAAAGAGSPAKEKKKRAPMSEEAKAAKAAKKAAKTEVDDLTNAVAAMTVEEKPVKTKKAKVAEDANLAKMDPTWKKHLKAAAKAEGKEVTKDLEAELLGYLNQLTKEEFAGKKAEEHVKDFLRPQTGSNAAAVPEQKNHPADLDIVLFNGQDYYVNPETKRVYEGEGTYDDDTGGWTNYKPVGYVGMAAFADMKLA